MAAPDPYASPSPAAQPESSMAEAASPDAETESPEEDAAEGGEEGEVLKNHLYLPGDFPSEKKPEPGDKRSVMADIEYVEMKGGEQCWKVDSVDGVPISSEGKDETDQMGEENESTTSEASADEGESEPSGGNDATLIILGRGKRKK